VNTFFWYGELAALCDLDVDLGFVPRLRDILDLLHNFVALEDFAKDDVLAIKMAWGGGGDEELRAIGVLSCVGHGEEALLGVLELEVLIWELVAVDRLPTSAITPGEVSTLDHEILNDTVEGRPLISKVLLSGGQRSEVLGGLGDCLAIQTHHDATHRLVAMADVEVDFVGDFGAFDGLGGLGEEDEGDGEDQ